MNGGFFSRIKMEAGPLAYRSRHAPKALTEDEEALLVFAAIWKIGTAKRHKAGGAQPKADQASG